MEKKEIENLIILDRERYRGAVRNLKLLRTNQKRRSELFRDKNLGNQG